MTLVWTPTGRKVTGRSNGWTNWILLIKHFDVSSVFHDLSVGTTGPEVSSKGVP